VAVELLGAEFLSSYVEGTSGVECGCDCTGDRYVRLEGQRGGAAR